MAGGAALSYPALTAFCRRQGIGQTPIGAAGQYHFEPGVEMQHDTSPHEVEVGGKKHKAQTASAVLCYSRMLFFQINPTFQRFDCKVFLTDALRYFSGATERVMIDNTHVVVLRGTGREMIPVPEMEAFAERFGFRFVAHESGDANRSARVERPFSFHRKQLSGGAHVRQLGGPEPTGAAVVRPGQLDLQEAYPRRAARVVRGRAPASETAAGVDSGSVSSASAHGGSWKATSRCTPFATRFRSPGSGGGWRCARPGTRSRSNWMRGTSSRTGALPKRSISECRSPSTGRRAGRGVRSRSASGRKSDRDGGAGDWPSMWRR